MKKIVLIIVTIVSVIAANLSYASDFDQQPNLSKPLSFTENKGQIVDQNFQKREDVLFGGQSNGMTFHLRTSGISYQLYRADKTKIETDPISKKVRTVIEQQTIYRIDVNWLNTNPTAQVKKGVSLEGFDNYYTSGCLDGIHNVQSYSDVTYQNLYKGIDLKWYQKDNQLKYDYLCAAGSDYKQIKIELNGSEKLSLDKNGDLLIQTPLGTIIEQAPLVIQNGKVLKSNWILANSVLSFHIENLDKTLAYIIDPMVRSWGTYYGGTGTDFSTNVQTDASGNVFMTGYTSSANGTSIATVGSFQTTTTGIASDAFLVKFNAAGVRQWGTYYGGDDGEKANSCGIDNNGNIYIGCTSTPPTSGSMATPGSHMPIPTPNYNQDLLLVKFNSVGARIWATYYGGLFSEDGGYVSVDNNDNVYLVGSSSSTDGIVSPTASSPTTYQPSPNGSYEGFIAKFDSSGVRQWSTYYGGFDTEILTNCTMDQFGNIIICGITLSSDLPVDAISPIYKGSEEAFFAKFDSSGQKLVSRYFGGSNSDYFYSVSVDSIGNLFLVGGTNSDSLATLGAHDSIRSSTGYESDGLITKFASNGATLWASYFGKGFDGRYCKTDINGNLFVGGQSYSLANDTLVVTPGAYKSVTQGIVEGTLSKWSASGTLLWGTYYGGNKTDVINGLAFAPNNGIYICGYTNSDSSTTIASAGSNQSTFGGTANNDGFLAKMIDCSGLSLTENNRTNLSCHSGGNGAASVNVATGGISPYTYDWTGTPTGDGTLSVTGLTAGTWICTVTDSIGCYDTISFTLTSPPALGTTVPALTNVTCNGGNNGSAFVDAFGGVAPYSYVWSGSSYPFALNSNLTAGLHTCTVTDANGCIILSPVTITQPLAITSNTVFIQNVNCNGGFDGSISINAFGGSGAYSYSWTPFGGATNNPTNLPAGSYTCTITDGNMCTKTHNATVSQPSPLIATVASKTNVLCNGASTGSITLTVSGGTPFYSYLWSNGGSTATISSLSAGTYTCNITDVHSCTTSIIVTVTEPASAISSSISSQTNVLCNGGSTGSATVSANGGTGALSYSWSPSGGTSATASGLIAGTYTCTITDANSCSRTQNVTITQPASALSGSTVITNVSCNADSTGAINLTTTGGTAPYTFDWGGGITTEDRTGLTPGTYNVTITDANSCIALDSATITQPATALSVSTVITNVNCNANSTGAINLTATGGTAPYTFDWGGGITTEDRTGLTAGTYNVTITDTNGCTVLDSATITQPATALSASTVLTNVSCNTGSNGAINLTIAGGTAPYTFNWGGGITTEDRTGLTAGAYSVVITDANGCTNTHNVTITQPTAITSTISSQTNVLCFGANTGAATVFASGGTGAFTYSWSPSGGTATTASSLTAGTYIVTITDANACTKTQSATITQPSQLVVSVASNTNVLCNGAATGSITSSVTGGVPVYTYLWSTGATSANISGLSAGSYTCYATDANGCTTNVSSSITQPASITGTAISTNVACFGGTTGAINLTATGGTAPYTFNWGGGITTEDRTGLTAGSYSVTITDANGCTATTSVTITQPGSALSGSTVITNVSCNAGTNGAINLTATGGTAPYTYNWGGGITTEDRTGLTAGSYSVTITDANGCTATASATITQPAASVSGTTAITNVSCNAGSNGAINLTTTGGTAPYTYNWGGGITTEDRTSLAAGTYNVTITDANSCTASVSAIVSQPTALNITSVQTNVSCNGGSNGSIDVTVSGGTSPYTYSWGSGITTQDRTGLSIGTYIDTITDANACQSLLNFTITQPTAITSSVVAQTNILCNGSATGAATVSASGGTGSYTYSWSPSGGTAATATGLAAGVYTCTITDANSCTKTETVTITQLTGIGFTSIVTNISCFGGNNGEIDLTANGGTAPYTYNWGGGITTEDRTTLIAGPYSVTITDSNACASSFSINVTQPAILSSSIAITNASCFAGSDGELDITVSGGTAPYSYFWISSLTSEDLTSRSAGLYSVEIADAQGCTLNDTAIITQPTEIISTSLITNVDCSGNSTGAIDIVPSGGFGPYTYNWGGGITTEDRTGLTAGTYSIAITDATSCVSNISVTVSEPNVLSATNSTVNVACFGASTGSIDLTVTGGTAPYTYNWGGGLTSQDLTNLPSGSYTVSVTDDHGCTTTSNATLTQPTDISVVKDSLNILCFGDNSGMANVTVSGGVGPYSYTWNGTSVFTSTANFLTAGNYSVEITDNNGCMKTADFELTQNPAITSSFSISQCDPYTWESNFYPISGTYQQIFSAVNGCDSTVTLNLNVFGYPTISISASESIICAGESVTLNATGGVSTATWDNGVINNQAFVPTSTTTYTATIANAQGCETIESIDVFVRDLPLVFMENFADSTCLDANMVACPFATPAGGIYSGSGVTGVLLNTQVAGLGQHEVIYTYSDQFGCTNTDTSTVNIVECDLPPNETGISENETQLIQVWPNPTFGTVQIETTTDVSAVLTDCFGKIIQHLDLKAGQTQIDLSNESMGVYFIVIQDTTQQVIRLIKN